MRDAADEEDRLALADAEGRQLLPARAEDDPRPRPAAAIASASAMRGVTTCLSSTQANPADITGVRVKTAAVETGVAVCNPLNIVPK